MDDKFRMNEPLRPTLYGTWKIFHAINKLLEKDSYVKNVTLPKFKKRIL